MMDRIEASVPLPGWAPGAFGDVLGGSDALRAFPCMATALDGRGRIADVSDAWTDVMGYRREEVLSRSCTEFQTESSRRYAQAVIMPELVRLGRATRHPVQYVTRVGRVLDLEMFASMDTSGAETRFTVVLFDAAERRRAQRALADRERAYRETIEALPDYLLRMRPDGVVILANRRYLELRGLGAEEVTGRRLGDILPPAKAESLAERTRRLSATQDRIVTEEYDVTADGSEMRIVWTDHAVLSPAGAVAEILSIGRDVSEASRMATQIRQQYAAMTRLNEELADANEGLRQFGRIASHDLQEPISKLRTYAALLRMAVDESDEATFESALTTIERVSERAGVMLSDLKTYCHVADRRLVRIDIELANEIDLVWAEFGPQVARTQAVIENDVPRGLILRGDVVQVRQILRNLVSNALKYRDPARACRVEFSVRAGEDGGLELEVADNGIGFDPRFADLVFEPFRRLHGGQQKGSGIGLAICAAAARRHGWRIRAVGRPGDGCSFILSLPAADLADVASAEPSHQD